MAFIDMVEWRPQTNDVFAWRYPESNLSTATQLVVRESQQAVLFTKGKLLAKFGPGKHTLTTENVPLLRSIFGVPFGGKNPFTAEVWFVNLAAPLTIDWRTTPMRIMDADYGTMIPLVATGRYGLKVGDAERFLIKLVGTLSEFNTAQLTDHFMGPLITKTNSTIVSYMTANRVGINQIAAYLERLSTFMEAPLKEFWESYGMVLTGFYVTSIDLDTSSEDGRKIAKAMSDKSAQTIAGYTWQQSKTFDVANDALSGGKMGGGMGILGAAMLMGSFGGNMGGTLLTPPTQQYQGNSQFASNNMGGNPTFAQNNPPKREVFCSNCGKKFPASSKFCPFCGDPYNACPVCGADNATGSKRCVVCGADLSGASSTVGETCSRCGSPIQPGLKFCPNCGNKIS